MHKHLFQEESVLRQIVTKIVIPNLTFRESDEETFEDDPVEFITTEVEGSDSGSRRRCSQDLLRAMCRQFETETTAVCSEHVGSMLSEYSKDPNGNWRAKDAAVC
jgi:exportin-2 (importin alpha re-exporter)